MMNSKDLLDKSNTEEGRDLANIDEPVLKTHRTPPQDCNEIRSSGSGRDALMFMDQCGEQ